MAIPASLLNATNAFPLWDTEPMTDAFTLTHPDNHAVVTHVSRPWLFHFAPPHPSPTARGVLIIPGGGYTQLMIDREGTAIATWLTTLNLPAFLLLHRFPSSTTPPQAPLDDAHRALALIHTHNLAPHGLGLCGLSSGGHLAAALLAAYPPSWTPPNPADVSPKFDFAIIAYAPISTNAKGRTVVAGKPPLEPPQKQALYNALQPDVQLRDNPPPTFIVYAGTDEVVPVANAYRLAQALGGKGGMVELHVFGDAPHGFGVDSVGLPVAAWPGLCEGWMRQVGVLG
ncbi:alpha/beta-hydrolase [Karstenula rhodostoma CBS 690.94]|uniref:Alpha/beta-hydrolase n=1 Tax=Karstenula rhodostoma CBS 690.94 TaxID=1392251 RepID=A0A9P4U5N8_9PLEO|nr:alpha/beta-hydrolase [Karstenula rhodostoma CBS 690.94]